MEKALRLSPKKTFSSNGEPSRVQRGKRLEVVKTYKIYIGGQFPRTESGRYYIARNRKNEALANVCLSSRKDVRDAVAAARTAWGGWARRPAFNKGQVLYRIAEMLEGRKLQLIDELVKMDIPAVQAKKEVALSVDRLVYYAGWCDKYQQVFSSVNPVASSHFNFSMAEPMGVVVIVVDPADALLGMVSLMAPIIAGGNTCIVMASEDKPLSAVTFAEVLHSSDLPGGVVNVLTGKTNELVTPAAGHMDVNAMVCSHSSDKIRMEIQQKASVNVKRTCFYDSVNWHGEKGQSPFYILDTQEIKTTWHPIENTGGSGGKY